MIHRKEFLEYINQLLQVDRFKDYAPNGLQVEGCEDIAKICTAVTASDDVIEQAIQKKADVLLVHHGFFWKGEKPEIVGIKKTRIAKLLKHNINLLAYHLPLDCHKELGNNACLAKKLHIDSLATFEVHNNPDLLWYGSLHQELSADELSQQIHKALAREPLLIRANSKKTIKHVAWCSGGAQDFIEQAASLGADAYISGEVSERTYYQAKEMDIHYFSAGHHATERYGIQALGTFLSERFQLQQHFIDSSNPV